MEEPVRHDTASKAAKGKRGRKQETGTTPNKSRDIQRAFRERKQAELTGSYARVAELEKINAALRLKYNEPELETEGGQVADGYCSESGSVMASPGQDQEVKEEEEFTMTNGVREKSGNSGGSRPHTGHRESSIGTSGDGIRYTNDEARRYSADRMDEPSSAHWSYDAHPPRRLQQPYHSPSSLSQSMATNSWDEAQLQQQYQLEQHRLSASILTSFAPSPSASSPHVNHSHAFPLPDRLSSRGGSRNGSFNSNSNGNGNHEGSSPAAIFSHTRFDARYSPVAPTSIRSPFLGSSDISSPRSIINLPIHLYPTTATSPTAFYTRAPSPTPSEEEAFLTVGCGLPPTRSRHLQSYIPSSEGRSRRRSLDEVPVMAWTEENDGFARFCARMMRGLEITGKGKSKRESWTTKEAQLIAESKMTEEEKCCGGLLDCEGAIFEDSAEEVLPAGYTSIEITWRTLRRFSSSSITSFIIDGVEGERRGKFEPEELATKVLESGIVLKSLPPMMDSPAVYPSSPGLVAPSPSAMSNGGGGGGFLSNNLRFERTLGLIVVESVVLNVQSTLEEASRRRLI